MSETRCGYVEDVRLLTDRGTACCWRPVRDGNERCFWHATDSTVPDALDGHRPEPGERLDGANLRDTDLTDADWLCGRSLVGADFTGANLRGADLSGADLRRATFTDVDARRARFDRANLEGAAFADADLQDAIFARARLYRTDFTDIRLNRASDFGERVVYEEQVRDAEDRKTRAAALSAASWTYRELRRLAERDALPRRARRYYLSEKSARRRAAWARGEYLHALKLEGSRWVMGYGTSPTRVVASSLGLIACCGVIYPLIGGLRESGGGTYWLDAPLSTPPGHLVHLLFRGLYFSVVTFATLGYGDMQPIGVVARALAGVEGLLGSLLMALLVFVLTQRAR